MSALSHAFTVLAARVLSVLTGATLEYEVYDRPRRSGGFGPIRKRRAGFYSGTRAECRRYIAEEIRAYHKVFFGYGIRPTGQLILAESSNPTPSPTAIQTSKG